MSAFLKFTDEDDGTPVYVRAARIEAVYEVPGKTASFGLRERVSAEAHGYTGVRTFSGGNFYVTEPADDVLAQLVRSGR